MYLVSLLTSLRASAKVLMRVHRMRETESRTVGPNRVRHRSARERTFSEVPYLGWRITKHRAPKHSHKGCFERTLGATLGGVEIQRHRAQHSGNIYCGFLQISRLSSVPPLEVQISPEARPPHSSRFVIAAQNPTSYRF